MTSDRMRARWSWLVAVLCPIALTSCLFVVTTGPTSVSGATIVFVAIDERGTSVPSLRVTVLAVTDSWRVDGVTSGDGSFHCQVRAGLNRVRAEVLPPPGYVLVSSEAWPRQFDVPDHGKVRVEVRLARP